MSMTDGGCPETLRPTSVLNREDLAQALVDAMRVFHHGLGHPPSMGCGKSTSPEHDARVSAALAQINTLTAVQANAHRFGHGLEGSLSEHDTILILPLW
jgi:hypothetical protein